MKSSEIFSILRRRCKLLPYKNQFELSPVKVNNIIIIITTTEGKINSNEISFNGNPFPARLLQFRGLFTKETKHKNKTFYFCHKKVFVFVFLSWLEPPIVISKLFNAWQFLIALLLLSFCNDIIHDNELWKCLLMERKKTLCFLIGICFPRTPSSRQECWNSIVPNRERFWIFDIWMENEKRELFLVALSIWLSIKDGSFPAYHSIEDPWNRLFDFDWRHNFY